MASAEEDCTDSESLGSNHSLEEDFTIITLNGDYAASQYTVARYEIDISSETYRKAQKMRDTVENGEKLAEQILEARNSQEADLVELPPEENGVNEQAFLRYAADELEQHLQEYEEFVEGVRMYFGSE